MPDEPDEPDEPELPEEPELPLEPDEPELPEEPAEPELPEELEPTETAAYPACAWSKVTTTVFSFGNVILSVIIIFQFESTNSTLTGLTLNL